MDCKPKEGAWALRIREECGFRSECGAHTKSFWEVCPKRGKRKAEAPSFRKWGLGGTSRWETPACWLSMRQRPAHQTRAERAPWAPCGG